MSSGSVLSWFNEPELQAVKISSEMVETWTDKIDRCYSEKGRHYHTLQHLSDMMNHLHVWKEHITDYAAVVLAILFHDLVYNAQSSSNEDDSIEVFKTFAEEVNLKESLSQKITRMIKATIKHLPEDLLSEDSDLLYFLDFDMAILGQPQKVYDVYARNIRAEYCHMSDEAFTRGRTKVLETFMQRERIYFTEELHKAFENQARENMKREIDSLKREMHSQLTSPA